MTMSTWCKAKKWAASGILPLVIVGGSIYVLVSHQYKKFKKSFNLPFQVLKQEKRQRYIFMRPEYNNIIQCQTWNINGFQRMAADMKNFFVSNIPTKIAMHLPSSLLKQQALLAQRYHSPWQLLQDVTSDSKISQNIVEKISNHAWLERNKEMSDRIKTEDLMQDYEYRLLRNNLDPSYLCTLARMKGVDERLFTKPSPLPLLQDESVIEYKLYDLLTKLPHNDVESCLQYFTHGALTISDERQLKKGGNWCFGGNGLNYAREIVAQEKVESFCLQALVKHSKIASHCEAMVKFDILELLQQIHIRRPHALNLQRNTVRIISNLCIHAQLHPYILASGWLSNLVKMSNSQELPLRMEATRALANLDRRFSKEVYEDGVYEVYPRYKSKNDPAVDVVLIHGLLGGAFHTWRQRDDDTVAVMDYTNCWPETWLPQDLPNIRVVSVEYDTHLSDWMSHCPHQKETRTISFRSQQILEKLKAAGVGQNRPVIWIAHSMGGLVLKNMLLVSAEKNDNELVQNTKGVIFYSTPHFGSRLAEYSRKVRKLLFPSVEVMALSQDSPQLLHLNTAFKELIETQNFKLLSFGEMQSTDIGLGKVRVHIVPLESADIGVGTLIMCDTDHLNICKPASRYSTVYRQTVDFIKCCISNNDENSPDTRTVQ